MMNVLNYPANQMETRSSLSRSLHTNRGLEKLEPYEGKLSCTVLRGEEGSNALDLPDRPSDLEQRNGRGVRAGNEIAKLYADNKVDIIIYAVEKSLDSYKFNLLHCKQTFISQLKSGALGARTIDEGAMDEKSGMNFSEYMAILSGNTDLLDKAKLEKKVASLEGERKSFNKGKRDSETKLQSKTAELGNNKASLKGISEEAHVLVDVGISGKSIEKGLNSLDLTGKDVDGILITHEHSDHIKGLGVISRKYGIPIYTTGGTADAMLRMKSLGKMPEGLIHEIREDEPFGIKDLTVNPFTIPHDAAQPVGYRLECGEHSVGIATDLGKYNDYIVKNLENLDAVLLEANHDIRMLQVGKYPYYLKQRILGDRGHLSNENAGRLLCRILHDNLKAVFLGHLSRENNYEELAYETVCSEVTLGDNPYRSRDFKIQVAKRDHISEIITV